MLNQDFRQTFSRVVLSILTRVCEAKDQNQQLRGSVIHTEMTTTDSKIELKPLAHSPQHPSFEIRIELNFKNDVLINHPRIMQPMGNISEFYLINSPEINYLKIDGVARTIIQHFIYDLETFKTHNNTWGTWGSNSHFFRPQSVVSIPKQNNYNWKATFKFESLPIGAVFNNIAGIIYKKYSGSSAFFYDRESNSFLLHKTTYFNGSEDVIPTDDPTIKEEQNEGGIKTRSGIGRREEDQEAILLSRIKETMLEVLEEREVKIKIPVTHDIITMTGSLGQFAAILKEKIISYREESNFVSKEFVSLSEIAVTDEAEVETILAYSRNGQTSCIHIKTHKERNRFNISFSSNLEVQTVKDMYIYLDFPYSLEDFTEGSDLFRIMQTAFQLFVDTKHLIEKNKY